MKAYLDALTPNVDHHASNATYNYVPSPLPHSVSTYSPQPAALQEPKMHNFYPSPTESVSQADPATST
jgi:hypothetical protein